MFLVPDQSISNKITRDSKENVPVVAANAAVSDNKQSIAEHTEKEQETERKVKLIPYSFDLEYVTLRQ